MELAPLADAWLASRTNSGGRSISANTLTAYRRDLRVWLELLESEVGHSPTTADLKPLEASTVLSRMLTDRQDSTATRRRAFVTLSGFCDWLIINEKLDKNPLLGMSPPRPDKKLPVAFDDSEVARLFRAAATEDPTARRPSPALDMATLVLLGAAGLRASEAVALPLRDYRPGEDPLLRVTGKGNRERVVPLQTETAAVLNTYLGWRVTAVPAGTPPTYPLLIKPNGQPLTRYVLDYRIRKLYTRAGVPAPKGAASHALRHTFAISSLNGGAAVNEIQELLGHESMATTGVYLRASAAHLRQATAASAAARLLKSQ